MLKSVGSLIQVHDAKHANLKITAPGAKVSLTIGGQGDAAFVPKARKIANAVRTTIDATTTPARAATTTTTTPIVIARRQQHQL